MTLSRREAESVSCERPGCSHPPLTYRQHVIGDRWVVYCPGESHPPYALWIVRTEVEARKICGLPPTRRELELGR